MRALTLHRPWPWAIVELKGKRAKRIENRGWPPPGTIIGRFIALHSGRKFDEEGAEFIARVIGRPPPPEPRHPLGVVGVARVVGYYEPSQAGAIDDPWYMGRYGWRLADVIALPSPVPCRGAQRIRTLPPAVARRVLRQLPREVRSCV
jgi:hypothetical protein